MPEPLTKTLRRAGALCLCLALFTASAAWAGPTLTIGVGRDFYDGPDSRAYLHGSTNTWEALTYLDHNLRAQPWLAQSWQALDHGRTWVFHLRPGVRFHDGTKLDAKQAAASIRRIKSSPRYDPAGVYRQVLSIQAQGNRDVVFRLARPTPDFPNLAAYYSSPIIKPEVFDDKGRITKLIATGPFKLVRVRPGETVETGAFEGYWGERPVYTRVIFRTVLDAQTRAMALMAGEIDAVADVGAILPEQTSTLAGARGVRLKRQEVATTHYLFFNCARPPFDRAPARHWLAGLLDRAQLVRAFAPGAGQVAQDPYTPLASQWAYGLLRPGQGKKPARPGRELRLVLHGGTVQRWPYLEIAQVLQGRLMAEGMPAQIAVLEPGAYYQALQKGEFDLAIQPNTLMTGDPDFFYAYYLAAEAPRNFGFKSPAMDQLISQARGAMDPTRRRDLYRRLAELFSQELPLLPLYHDVSLYAHGPKVARFEMDHNFRPLLTRARPKETP